MPATRECPMCGGSMRRETHERPARIPGTAQATRQIVEEWTCPECDYFEEADEGAEQ